MQQNLAEADDIAVAAATLSRSRLAPGPADPATVAFGGHMAFRQWQQVSSLTGTLDPVACVVQSQR